MHCSHPLMQSQKCSQQAASSSHPSGSALTAESHFAYSLTLPGPACILWLSQAGAQKPSHLGPRPWRATLSPEVHTRLASQFKFLPLSDFSSIPSLPKELIPIKPLVLQTLRNQSCNNTSRAFKKKKIHIFFMLGSYWATRIHAHSCTK